MSSERFVLWHVLANSVLLRKLLTEDFRTRNRKLNEFIGHACFLDWRSMYCQYPEHVHQTHWHAHVENHILKERVGSSSPVMLSIQALHDDFLEMRDAGCHLQLARFHTWQNLLARMSPFCLLAYRNAASCGWNERAVLRQPVRVEHLPLCYPHEPMIEDYVRKEGLNEVHLHLNCSQWHDPCWVLAMDNPWKECELWQRAVEKNKSSGYSKVAMLFEKIEPDLTPRKMSERLRVAAEIRSDLMEYAESGCTNRLTYPGVRRYQRYPHLPHRVRLTNRGEYRNELRKEMQWMEKLLIRMRIECPEIVHINFLVYLLIRNQHFQLCSQRDDLSGFSQFQAYTDMDRGFGEHTSYYKHVFQCLHGTESNSKVRYLEGRVSMKNNPSAAEASFCKVLCAYGRYMADRLQDARVRGSGRLSFLLPELKQMIKKAKRSGDRFMALALVVHLIKRPWKARKNSSRRYPDTRDAAESQASLLVEMLQRCRDLRSWVRGLDAAADELDAPAEVFAPAYRYARASRMIGHFTFHCGEDFHHLLGGIRAVGEAVMFLDLQRGDRVGHATALGIDPSLWLRRMPPSVCSERGRLLQDLVYAWSVLRTIGRVGREHVARLEEKACELGCAVFKKSVTMERLSAVFRLLPYHPKCVKHWLGARSRFHVIRKQGARSLLGWAHERFYEEVVLKHVAEDAMRLAVDWESSSGVLMRSQEMIELETAFLPSELYVELQQYVLRELAEKGIVIESLPTSNTRISVYQDLSEHHILRWMGVEGFKKEGDPAVLVALGSDDPGVFSTDIKAEFYHVYALLRQAGLGDFDALRKLDELNQRGAVCCFHDKSLYA